MEFKIGHILAWLGFIFVSITIFLDIFLFSMEALPNEAADTMPLSSLGWFYSVYNILGIILLMIAIVIMKKRPNISGILLYLLGVWFLLSFTHYAVLLLVAGKYLRKHEVPDAPDVIRPHLDGKDEGHQAATESVSNEGKDKYITISRIFSGFAIIQIIISTCLFMLLSTLLKYDPILIGILLGGICLTCLVIIIIIFMKNATLLCANILLVLAIVILSLSYIPIIISMAYPIAYKVLININPAFYLLTAAMVMYKKINN